MPKRTDIHKIMLIGAGPIIIGQACEFDYSGTQACKALKEEGYEVVLVNSNPATIMTDPEFADRTYVEPITAEVVEKIIAKEQPDALLPTVGGQTALNCAMDLHRLGVLEQYNVELIGASIKAIEKAEDRELFKEAMDKIGLSMPSGGFAKNIEEAWKIADQVGFPAIIRPSYTLGGTGGSVVYNKKEYETQVKWGLEASPVHEVLIEQSILGWKEYELEVMRDTADNVVIICSIENFDPMGVHTGDSITVAPAQTLSDKEYQLLRDASLNIIREIGVDTGGSNIQFGINPQNGEMVVIEMNPRVSRSSALASKATGFPIAKIAAKLAVGYSLDEIPNDITRETPASFEPTIDYVVTKIPRFAFEKFPQADSTLTTQMKSVGEAMSIGRTFKESFQKALRSLEIDQWGFDSPEDDGSLSLEERLRVPKAERLWWIGEAFRRGMSMEEVFEITKVDPWFLGNIEEIVAAEKDVTENGGLEDAARLRELKRMGFSDRRLAALSGKSEEEVRTLRYDNGIRPVYKRVDTCGAEFEAHTPYLYSTYEDEDEADVTDREKIIILGGGPNRIGQGIEFDYCCVHAAFALSADGYETIMVNCNPETVSTDYDTSDRLYFEPLTLEDVMHIVEAEKPKGVIVQFGGQTPLKLAVPLEKLGVPILGTSPDAIDRAEDRRRFSEVIDKVGLKQPENGTATSAEEAVAIAGGIGYPVLVRPSYVLGGRAMEIVYDEAALRRYMATAVKASPDHPVLVDAFLDDAIEVDVDCLSDGKRAVVAGLMEHIEQAGVHSGDSACAIPPFSLSKEVIETIKQQTRDIALELGVVGLMNVQWAVKDGDVYVLEVNPRASRTVPFVSKAKGIPLAKIASQVMAGKSLDELGVEDPGSPDHVAVKEAVFPFIKFPNVDTILSPEMKSTGEVMGIDRDFGTAFYKSQIAAGQNLPTSGMVFISVRDADKEGILPLAKQLKDLGFELIGTGGTARFLNEKGIETEVVNKVMQGRPHIVDRMISGDIALVFNTTHGAKAVQDSYSLRRAALENRIPYQTTLAGARAAVEAIATIKKSAFGVGALQDYHSRKST
ncbi:MAG: carbamoyl-phosphate synthase large subunit [Chrysiogenetes bacterium]|nr:carbamoyl-phosphate synthase large subunit [Chrysiogenetes bacterium]